MQQRASRTKRSSTPSTMIPFPRPALRCLGRVGGISGSGSGSGSGSNILITRVMTECCDVRPSPIATNIDSRSVNFMSWAIVCRMSAFWILSTGRPCFRIAWIKPSRPWASASSRRSRANHCLILFRARGV